MGFDCIFNDGLTFFELRLNARTPGLIRRTTIQVVRVQSPRRSDREQGCNRIEGGHDALPTSFALSVLASPEACGGVGLGQCQSAWRPMATRRGLHTRPRDGSQRTI